MDHHVDKHKYRLKSLCRVCAKRSSNSSHKYSKEIPCGSYEDEILKYYKIDITTDCELKHSSVMCKSCQLRLTRCMKGKPLPDGFQSELDFSKTIWNDFDENQSSSECSVCSHFEILSTGGRPRGGKGNARKRLHASFDKNNENENIQSPSTSLIVPDSSLGVNENSPDKNNENENVQSPSTSFIVQDSSLGVNENVLGINDVLDSSVSSTSFIDSVPLESTPISKKRKIVPFTPPPAPRTMDASTDPRTPTPKKQIETQAQTTPVAQKTSTTEMSTNTTPNKNQV